MVLLDVVYNHFGPDGNYLGLYAQQFFTARHKTPWGNAINFDDRSQHGRAAVLHSQRSLLARGVSLRRPAARRRPRDRRRFRSELLARARRSRARDAGRPRATSRARERSQRRITPHARRGTPAASVHGTMERRFPSRVVRAIDGRDARPLRRLRATRRAVAALAARRLRLPGRALRASRRSARQPKCRAAAGSLRQLPTEPRPDRQSRRRRAHVDAARAATHAGRRNVARAVADADLAVHGRRVSCAESAFRSFATSQASSRAP